MVKRKLDGTVDNSLSEQQIYISDMYPVKNLEAYT